MNTMDPLVSALLVGLFLKHTRCEEVRMKNLCFQLEKILSLLIHNKPRMTKVCCPLCSCVCSLISVVSNLLCNCCSYFSCCAPLLFQMYSFTPWLVILIQSYFTCTSDYLYLCSLWDTSTTSSLSQ